MLIYLIIGLIFIAIVAGLSFFILFKKIKRAIFLKLLI